MTEPSASTAAPRILITRPLPGDAVARFHAAGHASVWQYPADRCMPRSELLTRCAGIHGLLATPMDVKIDAELFDAAGPQLVVVSNYAVGVDNIDLEEAARRGVAVGHTPGAVTEPTADVAWLLLLGAARRATEGTQLVRSGSWTGIAPDQLLGERVVGKTLLIVGAGRIGYATARRSLGWNMKVLYHARSRHPEFEAPPLHATRVELDEGLAQADVVSIHTPLTAQTRHLFDADRLARLRPTAILVNTARGAVIDEAALVDALRTRRFAAAGLDVYENEPALHPGLTELDNVFMLPHLGSATREDRIWMMEIAVDNVVAALAGEAMPHRIA
ncbi:MAG: D-glycerate dehydrogenase [Phycisphaerae bacterium]|nr:D-glycerate dehydrogenase [Phycisphaerae bacterium]NNF42754.1 D-glycerate dehydrogenase [Phycisphaerales bacterium]